MAWASSSYLATQLRADVDASALRSAVAAQRVLEDTVSLQTDGPFGIDRIVVSDHVAYGEDLEAYGDPKKGGSVGGKQPTTRARAANIRMPLLNANRSPRVCNWRGK